MHEQIGDNKILYLNTTKAYHTEHINTTLDTSQLASYHFQSLIGLANLHSAIFYYKIHNYFKGLTREHKGHNCLLFGHFFIYKKWPNDK